MSEVRDLLTQRYEGLTAQQRRAARYMLDHPSEVAMRSMREVATMAGLPAVTFVRLARSIGFENYQSLRESFQNTLRSQTSRQRYASKAKSIQRSRRRNEPADLMHRVFACDASNITATYERNDPKAMLAAVSLLERSRRIYVLGQRACYPAACLFHYIARLFTQKTTLVRGNAGMFSDELRAIGKDDVLLVISIDPYTSEVVHTARYAKEQGVLLVAISDDPLSPVARIANASLLVSAQTESFFHSVTAITTLVQAVLALMVSRGGKGAVQAIAASEAQLNAFDAYWRDPQAG